MGLFIVTRSSGVVTVICLPSAVEWVDRGGFEVGKLLSEVTVARFGQGWATGGRDSLEGVGPGEVGKVVGGVMMMQSDATLLFFFKK